MLGHGVVHKLERLHLKAIDQQLPCNGQYEHGVFVRQRQHIVVHKVQHRREVLLASSICKAQACVARLRLDAQHRCVEQCVEEARSTVANANHHTMHREALITDNHCPIRQVGNGVTSPTAPTKLCCIMTACI
jgi:hypothetical protein